MQNSDWCVYTGNWHPSNEMTDDHIIPVSLGGHDQFTIRASKEGNEHVNRILDEKFGRHPFVANLRRTHNITGRRKSLPKVKWPAQYKGVSGNVDWSKENIEFESFRSTEP